jgi:hypothetical protein
MRALVSLPLVASFGVLLAACPGGEDSGDSGIASEVTDVQMVALVADNETGDVDENDQMEDWVDISNTGTEAIDLQGWTLTDDPDAEEPWAFPAVQLVAGGTLRVWCDNDPEDGELHATFKLSKDGESLTLFDASGAVVDSVTWPALGPDEVYAWDGTEWSVRE